MQKVIVVCGVSASGKSWACRQAANLFHYIPHDRCWVHPGRPGWDPSTIWAADLGDESRYLPGAKSNHLEVLIAAAKIAKRPVLTECPFAERILREGLEAAGLEVVPLFVIESPHTVSLRYRKREKKPTPQNVLTRAKTIKDRAKEWRAPQGTSDEILKLLQILGEP